MWYAYVIGYGFAVFGAAILVKSVVETLWDCIAPEGVDVALIRPPAWQGEVLSRIEGVLYVASLELGLGQLIGIWLVLKVAGHWKRWMEPADSTNRRPDGPAMFNIFLVGNALTVIYSFVGFKLIHWVLAEDVTRVIWVSLTVVALTLAFWAWIPGLRKSKFV